MRVCCDTSFLYALYGRDSHTQNAVAMLKGFSGPLTISGLNEFELTNALYYAAWRRLLTTEQVSSRLAEFETSRKIGRIVVASCDLGLVTLEAHRLAITWTLTQGNRSFDILHVAAARHLHADVFLTFDARQQALAQTEGLALAI